MKQKITVCLENSTPENWNNWKNMEAHISKEALIKGVVIDDVTYHEGKCTKTCLVTFNDPVMYQNAIIEMQSCAFENGLKVRLVSKVILSNEGLEAINEYRQKGGK